MVISEPPRQGMVFLMAFTWDISAQEYNTLVNSPLAAKFCAGALGVGCLIKRRREFR